MSEYIPEVVTGDDVSVRVRLKKNGATFDIPIDSIVHAMLVSRDNLTTLTESVVQLSTAAGADWANSLVAIEMPTTATAAIVFQGLAKLEIQVNDDKKLTWFVTISVIRGNIA